ncbi:MAG: UbiA family prenyltransferase, partial [Candidatus Niyogibacteria bacterium]|nr:UbiA family prenyltransferase [Candidatus Niyogibacteria bacterium]
MKSYIEFTRRYSYIFFATVVLFALFFASSLTPILFLRLLLLYIAFNVFLYTGIYTINDIADIENDKKHPVKKRRPLPSGRIAKRHAVLFAAVMISFGMGIAWLWFGEIVVFFFLL